MSQRITVLVVALLLAFAGFRSTPTHALDADTLQSVVSILPVWPGRPQGGRETRRGAAPEGTGVVLEPRLIATAWHVVKPATRIDVRLSDGRILPAQLVASDVASDIAVLSLEIDLVPIKTTTSVKIAQPVCAVGNAYGLGLSVTCGVVSALNVTNAGFNPVEDFVQTDAATNPGMSGGALVDRNGRLVGMLSAIFASKGDSNSGVNFAVSTELLLRVVEELRADGEVSYPSPGWHLKSAEREQLARVAAPVVGKVSKDSPAARTGILPGDLILRIGTRRVLTPRDALSALAIFRDTGKPLEITVLREGKQHVVDLFLKAVPEVSAAQATPDQDEKCPHPKPVCRVRQAVFPVASFDPVASATRIGISLLVTNRHVVADRPGAIVYTPDGPRKARVIPSAYAGDLALLQVQGLPEEGFIPKLQDRVRENDKFYTVGADIVRKEVRVFNPGGLIARPARGADLGRLHVRSLMQPGVSGGALVNAEGQLVGIAVGGGDGRYEALPAGSVQALMALRTDPRASEMTQRLGKALSDCTAGIEAIKERRADPSQLEALTETCGAAMNHGQLLEAGRLLARARDFVGAITLHGQAAEQVPNSINARISLLVSLQLAGRFEEMISHSRKLMRLVPEDPRILRFAIQSGVWGNAPELAEEAYRALVTADPRQAAAARRFIDNAPPAPVRRQ